MIRRNMTLCVKGVHLQQDRSTFSKRYDEGLVEAGNVLVNM